MQKLKNTTTSFIIFAVLFSAFFPVLGSTKVSATGNSTLSLEKLVKKEADTIYVSQINANFGETVDFKLKVTNTGDMTLSDLNVSDVLPVNLTFLSGSLVVAAPTYGGELFSSDGLNIHDLAVGESQEITFKATVAANDQFGVGETILTNTATAVEKGSTSSSPDAKTASVKVTKNVDGGDPLPPPSGGGGSTCTHKVPTGYVHGANATLNVPDGACPVKVSFSSYSHAGTIQPFDAQVLIENITQTYGPGTYNVGPIKLECNWQTDLYLGEVQYPLSAGGHTGLIDADYVEHQNCNPTQTNTPPTITLIGANPLNITIGTQFTDPGATATDTEDGDLTSQIVKTGTVNASTTGTYTLTYVVKDSGNLYATTTRVVNVNPKEINPPVICFVDIVSDTSNQVVGGSFAMATYSQNPRWTASIPGATWIWKTFFVPNPEQDETQTFSKTFNLISTSTVTGAELVVSADNSYTVSVNGVQVGADTSGENYFNENKDTYNVIPNLVEGINTVSFTVKNWGLAGATAEINPAGLLYKLHIVSSSETNCTVPPVINVAPTIALVGANPFELTVGTVFTDPGATATDTEDGDLTSQIVKTGTVNASTTGTYTLTYVVKDSGNLYATTTRTVIVNPVGCTTNCGGGSNNPSVSLTANSGSIIVGATSTLSWTSVNTNSCSASWTTATSTSGSKDVAPGVTTDYSIACTGVNGTVSATTTVTVITAPVNPPGGGGGGGSSSGGRRHPIVVGEILGATSCSYLRDYLKIDWQNDPIEVLKLQSFLNVFEKENLSLTGKFDQTTFDAVARFQTKYSQDILIPWGEKVTKGFVYILTKKKVNEIYCNTVYPLSQSDQNEIDAFRNAVINGTSLQNFVGVGQSEVPNKNLTISDISNATGTNQSILRNVAIALFALPQRLFGNLFDSCGNYIPLLLIFILIALIIDIIVRWFKGSKKDSGIVAPSVASEPSPIVVLPGVLPDEEIVIENPEETEETVIAVPDLRNEK